jgi:M6 family metalloprotease-like protein
MKGLLVKGILISLALAIVPVPAFSAQKVTAGSVCKLYKQKVTYQNKVFTCTKSGKKLVWNKGVVQVKPTPTPTAIGDPIGAIGGTPAPTIKSVIYAPPSENSDNIELCKIKEVSKSRGMTGAGFPVWNSLTPRAGTMKWALIPLDFPDLPGEKVFRPRVDDQMKLLSEWYSTVSEGKFKVEWVVHDKWVTLPGKSTDYVIPLSVNVNNAANGPKLFIDAMNAADPVFNFTNVQTVNFILPSGQIFMGEGSQGFPWDTVVKEYVSNKGRIASYSIPGQFFELPGKTYWSYWAHEFGHAIGIPHIGVSRGDRPAFSPLDLMGAQDGPSRELSGWLRFYAEWLPDEKVYCKELQNLKSVELTLAPLSGTEPGIKFGIFPVSATKAVMIESRRVTKFSCTTPTVRDGVLVYIYDATLGHGENFLIPVSPPGRALELDSCGSLNARSGGPTTDMLLHEGETLTVEGITIGVLASSNYDKLVISRKPS